MREDADTGYVRVTAISPRLHIADPASNAEAIAEAVATHADSDVLLFPELCLTAYTCGDLFAQEALLEASVDALSRVAGATHEWSGLAVVGMPLRVEGRLYNTAVAVQGGRAIAVVPKQFLPNYHEFYEARWFTPAEGIEPQEVHLRGLGTVPFGIDLLIDAGDGLVIGIELCEDLWMPVPPSSFQAAAGATLLLNLSASNELIGKAAWRRTLVASQSGRCLAAYAYASAGPSESTTDLVFGGHCLIAENGNIVSESPRVGSDGWRWSQETHATADIDLHHLLHDRQVTTSWSQACRRHARPFRRIDAPLAPRHGTGATHAIAGQPFIPRDHRELRARCSEIFAIQCAGLAKRIERLSRHTPLAIGVSGGLDSTLALLVATKTMRLVGWPTTRIHALTMPGFGTTKGTLESARRLMELLQVTAAEIDIRALCFDTFRALQHQPFGIDIRDMDLEAFEQAVRELPPERREDLLFENVQARVRTLLLMNRGFVIGTGDLSEQALGWSTYNADHMSMYNVNCSVPKTLVRFLIEFVAEHEVDAATRECLQQVLATPISPELLPPTAEGHIAQHTESVLGSYELHDFFLYHLVRFGSGPQRLLHLASMAEFSREYSHQEIRQTLRTFLTRFFQNQFKRSCVPDGPKVGSVSLSPRGDWRMPSDAEVAAWLHELTRDAEQHR
ncbi:MAG: NAD(+) synthase [Pirellulaceae bacterium]|nr:MAG: NAD(+) synthase [Pirellulaceae bacterium]